MQMDRERMFSDIMDMFSWYDDALAEDIAVALHDELRNFLAEHEIELTSEQATEFSQRVWDTVNETIG